MSIKSNAQIVEPTGGKLSFTKQWDLTISDQGVARGNIDFSSETWEIGNQVSHIIITNTGGSNDLYVVFDAAGSTITTTDRTTYNLKIPAGEIRKADGSASSMGMVCTSGLTTTVEIIAW